MEIPMEASKFGIVDYCVFAGMLLLSGGIGLYTSCRGNKSPEEFLMGNRSFKPLPIAMSLLTSFVSAISLLGFSGEAFAHGSQISLFVVGILFSIICANYVFLPVLYPLRLTSVNEYIELRFKSKKLHKFVTYLTCIQGVQFMGVCLYAPTIALVSVTNLNYLTYIFLLGVVCTIYSSFGGIRAVIWTDVFQLSVMLLGLLIVSVVGCFQNGGLIRTLYIASEGGRLDLFNMDPSPYVRHSFWNAIIFGFFFYVHLYGTDQINVQRMCSVRCIGDARKVLFLNIFGILIIYVLIFLGGIAAYASYADCDPMALGKVLKKEEIMPYLITDKMSFIPGLPGLFVATLIGGTMSSLSSVINAVVAMLWKDICLKFTFFTHASTRFATLTNKVMSLILGSLIIGMAILISKADSLLDISYTLSSVIKTPIFGVFLIGFFCPKCNLKGVWTGIVVSSALMSWIAIGAQFFYKRNDPKLPQNIDGCYDYQLPRNYSRFENNSLSSFDITFNGTSSLEENYQPLSALYGISYTLYCVIGPLLCVLVANIVSCFTGSRSVNETSPRYVTPFLRPFYWSKEDLSYFYEQESKMSNKINGLDKQRTDQNSDLEMMLNIPVNNTKL